jgi:glucans biosynthesis protein
VRKFVVEFLGGALATLAYGVKPEMVTTASRGSFGGYRMVEAVPDDVPGHWRIEFDFTVDGADPVEMRCFLQAGGQTVTETWMFQYHPF